MAEEHPPSPAHEDRPFGQEIAGQARNDVLVRVVIPMMQINTNTL